MSELTEAVEAARQAFAAATNLEELAVARREHLGDDAPISQARRALGSLPKNERKDAGRLVNQARGEAEKAYATAKTALEEKRNAEVLIAERVDVTVPTTRRQVGALHPITTLLETITDIFVSMGYEVADGPEVEAEYFNFDSLNFVPDHPARTLQDTFHVSHEGRGRCCGHTRRRCRCALCCRRICRFMWLPRVGYSAPMSWMPRTRRCFTRWRA